MFAEYPVVGQKTFKTTFGKVLSVIFKVIAITIYSSTPKKENNGRVVLFRVDIFRKPCLKV